MKKEPCAEKVSSLPQHSLLFMVSGSLYGPGTSRCSQTCMHTHTHRLLLTTSYLLFIQKGTMQRRNLDSCVQWDLFACVSFKFMYRKVPLFARLYFPSLSAVEQSCTVNCNPPKKSIFCLKTAYLALCLQSASPKNCEF